eukprot:241995_1
MNMIINILFLALIGYVSGQHANCNMHLTIKNTQVATLNSSLVKMVESRQGFNSSTCVYAAQQNEFCGYSMAPCSTLENHFKHETPTHHYVDDIYFYNWTQHGSDVVVHGKSQSEPNSLYDYDTNFCNIFNLFRDGNAEKLNEDLQIKYSSGKEGSCEFHPDTENGYAPAYKQCNTY